MLEALHCRGTCGTAGLAIMMFSCLMIVLCVTLEALAAEPPMFSDSKSKMTGDGKFKVYWMYNKSMDAVWFKVEAKVTGYVAFGVSAPGATGMNKYDMAVGGVRQNGTAYLEVKISILVLFQTPKFAASAAT